MILLQSDFGLFIGRFHALIVHLPIGFLLLGSIFYLVSKREKWHFLQKALPLTFLLSTVGAILAVTMGLLLAREGGYGEQTLFWHRNLGIATALLSGIFYLHFSGRLKLPQPITDWGLLAGFVVLSITGHFGGQLTHGQDYLLDYAPAIVKKTLGNQNTNKQEFDFPMNPDSVFIYQHIIQSIFDEKCVNCHNANQTRGGLNLASTEGLLAGGDHGDILENKQEVGSLLLHRVTLASNDAKFMPPKGLPLYYAEIRLLDYLINQGYSFEQSISDENIPQEIRQLIKKNYGLTSQARSFVELKQVPAADPEKIQSLITAGFTIKKLSQNSNFLEVSYRDSMDCAQLKKLGSIQSQISWLNLSQIGLSSDCLEHLKDFSNLTRLKIAYNPIDNEGLSFLKDLKHLESLNLYGTLIDESGLSYLEGLDRLQYLYLGQTKVDSSAMEQLKVKFPIADVLLD